MLLHSLLCSSLIATPDGLQDTVVALKGTLRPLGRPEPPRVLVLEQVIDHLHHPYHHRVVGRARQKSMKLRVLLRGRLTIRCAVFLPAYDVLQPPHILRRRTFGSLPRYLRLEEKPRVHEFLAKVPHVVQHGGDGSYQMLDGDLPDVVATAVAALYKTGHLKPADRLPYHRTAHLELFCKLPLRRQRLPRPELAADYEVAGPGRHLLVEFDAADRLDHRLWRVSFRRFHLIEFSISALEPVSSVRPPPAAAGGGRNRQGCACLLEVLAVGQPRSTAPARRALARRTKSLRAGCHGAYHLFELMYHGPLLSESARFSLLTCSLGAQRYLPSSCPTAKLVCPFLNIDCNSFASMIKQIVSRVEKDIT